MKNQSIIQNSPDAIYTCDQLGFIKSYNKAAVRLWGREPILGKDLWCGSWKIYDKDGGHLPLDRHPMAIALKEGRLIHGEELIVQRPDGSLRHVTPYSSPLVNGQGKLTGVVSMLMEVSEQKNKEKQREEKYKAIIEQASDAILTCSFDGTIHEFNKSCYTLLGYTYEEYEKLNLKDILVEAIIIDQENYTAILAGEARTVYRNLRRKDASELEVEITVKLLGDGKLIAFARDISEWNKAERALKESEAFTKNILTSISSHIAVVEENGTIISVNKAWNDFALANQACILERAPAGSNYITACSTAAAAGNELALKSLEGFYKILKNKIPVFEIEYPCQSQNEQHWFLLRITKLADDTSKVVMMHIDITARVNAAATTHKALERYDILTKATSDTIWDWDIANNRMTYNDVISKMFGYRNSQVKNVVEWWKNNIHPGDWQSVSALLDEVFTKELQNFQLEYRFRCADGTYKYVFDRAFILFDEKGTPVRMIGAMQDITERKKAEEDFKIMKKVLLEQKVEEQKKITRAIINAQEKERRHMGEELHDNINQMLAGTKLYLSIAASGNAAIKDALQYPMQLIDDTINEIRLLTRRSVTPKQNINLKELVETLLCTMFKNTAVKTLFLYTLPDDTVNDELKLNIYRIIQEQTSNIVKHADAAAVEISIKVKDHLIEVIVRDDGNGFDINKKREGIGIANIINRAESFNGEVAIESTAGNGCRLWVNIPY
jgi:two-component system sensor histidine kinase UhpB